MSIDNLVDTYISRLGLKRLKGSSASPLLPFFILDVMYQILSKEIVAIKVSHETKRALNGWVKNYNLLNRDFFSSFDGDQLDAIIDLMDLFTERISNDIVIAEVSIMKQLARYGVSFEDQKALAAGMMCSVLIKQASVVWEETFKILPPNRYIEALDRFSGIWFQSYFLKRYSSHINPNEDETICLSVDILCKKVVRFLDEV